IDHSKWMERPLDSEYQRYAAEDVHLLLLLHNALLDKNLIGRATEEQSGRYVMQHAMERPSPVDIYSRHSFLPLGIVQGPQDNRKSGKLDYVLEKEVIGGLYILLK
ncbi:5008_t:CDS:2, partial [Acaulospora colombiana]